MRGFAEFLIILVISFALVFGVVRPFIVEAFWIPSESMVPTLQVGDRVLVNKFIYRFAEPDRGDILVFKSVEEPGASAQIFNEPPGPFSGIASLLPGGSDPRQDLIKRVIGVPGDEIQVQEGNLFVNGELQNEPYVNPELPDSSFYGPFTVPEDHVFMMGDNRANSQDSRVFGPVPYENIEGEAFLLFWPLSNFSSLL
ncbi:MAG: signal peptidase I [Rubrobacter sp.]